MEDVLRFIALVLTGMFLIPSWLYLAAYAISYGWHRAQGKAIKDHLKELGK